MLTPGNSFKILLIERNRNLLSSLSKFLTSQGYGISTETDLKQSYNKILSNEYFLLIIDLDVKQKIVSDFLTKVKQHKRTIPIIVLGIKDEESEINAYLLGANIYHCKPVHFELLNAQIRQLTYFFKQKVIFQLDNIRVDISSKTFWISNNKIDLTYKEFCLTLFLINAEGGIVNRDTIITHIFNCNKNISYASVDTMISRIRKKLKRYLTRPFIQTIYKGGYRINPLYFNNLKIRSSKS